MHELEDLSSLTTLFRLDGQVFRQPLPDLDIPRWQRGR